MNQPPPLPGRHRLPLWIKLCLIPSAVVGLVFTVLTVLLAGGVIKQFVLPTYGMAPAVCPGDRVITARPWLLGGSISRGTLVVFDADTVPALAINHQGPRGYWIQRVVALPGDHFQIKDGQACINGAVAAELAGQRYRSLPAGDPSADFARGVTVPAGQYLVLGDNDGHSFDSRYWGFLPAESVKYLYCCHVWHSTDRSTTRLGE
jgi:signal peptidase I